MREILFQIGKKLYGDFSDVATGLRGVGAGSGVSTVEGSILKETSLIKLQVQQ